MRFARTDTSALSRWWWTVDHMILSVVLLLMCVGVVLAFAASPSAAERFDVGTYHFVFRHFANIAFGLVVLFAASFLVPSEVRRLGWILLALSVGGIVLTLIFAEPVNGARRWLDIGFLSLQPSEFAKPAFVLAASALIAARCKAPGFPGLTLSFLLYAGLVVLFIQQPDVGQAVLLTALWGILLFISGIGWRLIVGLTALAGGGLIWAYFNVAHVTQRIDAFLFPSSNDTLQVDLSQRAIMAGGWAGKGPGEGSVKHSLPDAHTDFIFPVAAEEYGFAACLIILVLFGVFVLRGMARAFQETDYFAQLAAVGLTSLIGVQAMVNMGVALKLLPAKGTTLPFLSYGGSSMLALGLSVGLLLALTRRRPRTGLAMEGWR